MATPPSFAYRHFDTIIIDTQVTNRNDICEKSADAAEADGAFREPLTPQKRGVFAHMVPLNKLAKDSLRRLATDTERPDTEYHRKFLEAPPGEADNSPENDAFVLSLDRLPELPSIGWRIGRGRRKLKNLGVDLLLPTDDDNDNDIAGLHARLSWVKGGGGFFLCGDNRRGLPVNLNGETLSYDKRLIPYANTIGIGQFYFTIKFLERTPNQEEEFQSQLVLMYSAVLKENTPLIMPTPSRNEIRIGEWVVRKPIARGSYGHVSSVTHARTGQLAAAKELWKTPQNSYPVEREVSICRHLMELKGERLAAPFEIYHEKVHNNVERNRIIALLDASWTPLANDTIDKFILYLPLSTSNFHSLITSSAPPPIRLELFAQILEGIAFLHSHSITHRDIKPANLALLTFDPPAAQILDFGCATMQKKILYDSPGTVPYLAPEQVKGRYADCTVDYWAIALTGLEVLGWPHRGRVDSKEGWSRVRDWIDKFEAEAKMKGSAVERAVLRSCQGMLSWIPAQRISARDCLNVHLREFRYNYCRGSVGAGVDEGKNSEGKRNGRGSPAPRMARKGSAVGSNGNGNASASGLGILPGSGNTFEPGSVWDSRSGVTSLGLKDTT